MSETEKIDTVKLSAEEPVDSPQINVVEKVDSGKLVRLESTAVEKFAFQHASGPRKGNALLRLLFRLDEILIPQTERQYTVVTGKSKERIVSDLVTANERRPRGEQLQVKVKGNRFTIAPPWVPLVSLFDPIIDGVITSVGGRSNIAFRTANTNWAIGTINAPFLAALAVAIGYIASLYLLPHPILLFSAVLGAIGIPIALCLITAAFCRYRFTKNLGTPLEFMCSVVGASDVVAANDEGHVELKARGAVPEEFIVGGVCGAIYLGAAVGLHALAWQLWVDGKYVECANLCHPVAALAEAALGKESATVGDCKYYLAESYRCSGKLPEAAVLYEKSIEIMAPTIGADNPFYADAVYNLGRVKEEQGKLNDADVQYRKALDIWAHSPVFGDDNIAYAKGLNRLGILRIKTGNTHEAEEAFAKAFEIDKRYGPKQSRVEEDLNDMAAGYIALSKYQKGLQFATKSLKQKQSKVVIHDLSLVPNYINIARANFGLYELNEEQEALDQSQKAFDEAAALLGVAKSPVNIESVRQLSALYGEKVKAKRAIYEVPNFDTRGDITYLGDGRI